MDFFPIGGFIFLLLLFALFCAAVGLVAYFVVPAIIQKIRHDSDEFKNRRQELLGG
jgi:hypothetical protein